MQDDDMSFGDFSSDLSDPPSTDEEDIPLSKASGKPKGKGKAAGTGYQITDALRPPRTAQYTAKSLYDQIIDNTIDLDPEYQRDVVWSEQKQSGIIDSILRNYYIPPVIFAVSSSDDGSELRTCIDGKQRLTSIQRFMDGLIPHKDSTTNQKLWFKQVGNSRRKLLPKQYMQRFSYKQITCVEYETLTEDQEREIFQRVQLGVALTPAERMQAITGPWPSLIRDIQQEVLGESGFEGHLDWGHARGRDFQCLTSIAYLIDKPKAAFPGAQQLEKWLQENDPVPAKFRYGIFDTFRVFIELVRKFRTTFHKPTKVAPVEFVMVGLLVHTYRTKLSLTQLNSAIEKLRADVRGKFTDIRQNTKVTKAMLEFINKKVKVSELKSDKQGDKPASSKARFTQTSTASKRKRAVYSDGDSSGSETFKPPPPKSSISKAMAGSSKAPIASSSSSKTTKTPAKQASATKPALKSAMSTSSNSAGGLKSSTIKSSTSTPRILKASHEAPRNPSPQSMAPPLAQRKQSLPPHRPPSAPPTQQSIKREPSIPPTPTAAGPSDRLGANRTAAGTQFPPAGGSQPVQDPRRPQPQVQTNIESASQQLSPGAVTPSFPHGTPLDQNQYQVIMARLRNNPTSAGPQGQHPQSSSISPVVQQSLNGTSGGHFPSGTPPATSPVPAFGPNPNNPLHSQSSSGTLQNGYSGAAPLAQGSNPTTPNLALPPQAPHAMRSNVPSAVNGTGSIVPSQSKSLPPPPNSSSSTASHPQTSLSSAGSGSWYNSQDQTRPPYDWGRDRNDDRYSRPPARSRDSREYDGAPRGRSYDPDRGYSGRYGDRGRSRSRERDGGWGSRGLGRNGFSRSPTRGRYGSK